MLKRPWKETRKADCGCRELEDVDTLATLRQNCPDHPYGEGSPLKAIKERHVARCDRGGPHCHCFYTGFEDPENDACCNCGARYSQS